VKLANEWASDYMWAERRGAASLRRFLDDLDAAEANGQNAAARTIGEVVQLYFAFNAPDAADGLAPSSFRSYRHVASRHLLGIAGMERGKPNPPARYAVELARSPAAEFSEPGVPRAFREAMRHARVGPSARAHAWRVLSAVLSWAASSQLVPEIESNGCLRANEKLPNRRKSMRGSGGWTTVRRHGGAVSSWALSPMSVELIRAAMLERAQTAVRPILAYRDAVILTTQFGLALRNQEVYGLRWSAIADRKRGQVVETLGWEQLEESGKTEHSAGRSVEIPRTLLLELDEWRSRLDSCGYSTRDCDFIVPGDLSGPSRGRREAQTGACHMTSYQAQRWLPRHMRPAVLAVTAKFPSTTAIENATPYSLRRGGISARLRGENAQSVAHQCGTSLEMLSQHYSYEIDEHGRDGPRSLDQQWQRARQEAARAGDRGTLLVRAA
jgi:integrase